MGTKFTTKDFIRRAEQVHGQRYDYSQTEYTRSRDKVKIICRKHGVFEQRASSHLDGCGCPRCQAEWSDEHKANHAASARKSRGMTTEEWIRRARFVHGDKYDYSQTVYVNERTDVIIICLKHGPFMQKADSHIRGCGCAKCGNESENHIGVHSWSDEQRAKTAATCLERYGAERYMDSDEGRQKDATIRQGPLFRTKMHDIISSDAVQDKTKSTCMRRYGVPFAMNLPETVDKVLDTKARNHTFHTSQPEEMMYQLLCNKFGPEDVKRQYKTDVYPFRCDFYVISLDLYLELNAGWFHGYQWFDVNDSKCKDLLERWQRGFENGHLLYRDAIHTWTVRDVKKRETAIRNKLNYLVFWKNDLSDFKDWLNTEPFLLNNISG